MTNSNSTIMFRLLSLTAAGLMLLLFFFEVDLAGHTWFDWIPKEKHFLINLILVVLLFYFNIEHILEYKKTNSTSNIIPYCTATFSFAALIIAYPKLTTGNFLYGTNRIDIILPFSLSLFTSFAALALTASIEMNLVFYKFRKTIALVELLKLFVFFVFTFLWIIVLYRLTIESTQIVFLTRYTSFTIIFLLAFRILAPKKKLFSEEKLEDLSELNDGLNRKVEVAQAVSDYGLEQKLNSIKDGKRYHKNVMKQFQRLNDQDRKGINIQYTPLKELIFISSGNHYSIEEVTDNEEVIRLDFLSKKTGTVLNSIDIKFKYVRLSIKSFPKARDGQITKDFLISLSLKACELQALHEDDENLLLCNMADSGPIEYLKWLFSNRTPNINFINEDGWTPLLIAAANGRYEFVTYLLQKAADPNIANKLGAPPLSFAAGYGNKRICKTLINHGAKLDRQDLDGQTALIRAATRGHGSVVNLLLENGADPNIGDLENNTALNYAEKGKYGDIARLLRKAMAHTK